MPSQRKNLCSRRLIALLLCALLVVPGMAGASTITEVENQIQALDEERAALDEELDRLRDDAGKKEEYQETLQKKIKNVETQLDQTRADIKELDGQIETLELKLEKSEEEISETMDLFKNRVRTLYKAGGTQLGTLELLLDSKSLNEFSQRNELLKSEARRNQVIMDKIEAYINETADERAELAVKKETLASKKIDLENGQKELDVLYEENLVALQEVRDLQADAEARQDAIYNEKMEYAGVLEQLIAEQRAAEEEARRQQEAAAAAQADSDSGDSGSVGTSGGGGGSGLATIGSSADGSFGNACWPMPGVYTVTQHYNGYGHYGIDIAGPSGTPIVALEDGQVIRANGTDWWGWGWGYHVLIYHNGTYQSLYAHMSSVAVSNGEYVSKGQTIGYEGSTGDSTGPHLHLEVYENGVKVNPWNFIG